MPPGAAQLHCPVVDVKIDVGADDRVVHLLGVLAHGRECSVGLRAGEQERVSDDGLSPVDDVVSEIRTGEAQAVVRPLPAPALLPVPPRPDRRPWAWGSHVHRGRIRPWVMQTEMQKERGRSVAENHYTC